MIIAIDGPAGSGKSTVAKLLAKKLNITFLNTGSFYRGITLALLRKNGADSSGYGGKDIDLTLESDIISFAKTLDFSYKDNSLFLKKENIEDYLRTDRVETFVAPISAIPGVRHVVNDIFRSIGKNTSVVCEGRDITTVVFPNADYKFYLDASVKARAKRRFNQGTSNLALEKIEKTLIERDKIDKNKKEGSLKIATDAIYIDTSDLTIKDVCAMIISKIH